MIVCVPKVAINGGTLSLAMIKPLDSFSLFQCVFPLKKQKRPWGFQGLVSHLNPSVSLLAHCICNLLEACNIGSLYIVDVTVGASSFPYTSIMDILHDHVQFLVDFLAGPVIVL